MFRLIQHHPKLSFLTKDLALRLAFQVPQWSCRNPDKTMRDVEKNSNAVIQQHWTGATMLSQVKSFTLLTVIYHCWWTWDNQALIPRYFRFSCSCPLGSHIRESGFSTFCKHLLVSVLDACPTWDRPGTLLLTHYAKATVNGTQTKVERIVYQKPSTKYPGQKVNLCKLPNKPMEDSIWIEDADFLSQEAHIQYRTLMNKLKYSIVTNNDI